MTDKIILYQIFTRLFGNKTTENIPGGTLQQNGSGKMNFIDRAILQRIKAMGVNTCSGIRVSYDTPLAPIIQATTFHAKTLLW